MAKEEHTSDNKYFNKLKRIYLSSSSELESDSSEENYNRTAMKSKRKRCKHCCAVCGSEYNALDRRPLSLPCGHTFCQRCLNSVQNAGTRKCPVCRRYFGAAALLPCCYQLMPNEAGLELFLNTDDDDEEENELIVELKEGENWIINNYTQSTVMQSTLTNSSVRPASIILTVGDSNRWLTQQVLSTCSTISRTRCDVHCRLLDAFYSTSSQLALMHRDCALLQKLHGGRCRLREYWGSLSRSMQKMLPFGEQQFNKLGISLTTANEVKDFNTTFASNVGYVTKLHISVSASMNLHSVKLVLPISMRIQCFIHFADLNDDNLAWLSEAVHNFLPHVHNFLPHSSLFKLYLCKSRLTMMGADAVLGMMRDRELNELYLDTDAMTQQQKNEMDEKCQKFEKTIHWSSKLLWDI